MSNLPMIALLLGMAVLTGGRLMSNDIGHAVEIIASIGCLLCAIWLIFSGARARP